MNIKQLRNLVNNGQTLLVEFTKRVEKVQSRFEEGMRAYVTGVTDADAEDIVKVIFEEREYREFNQTLEKPNWLNPNNGKYELRFSETRDGKRYSGKDSVSEVEYDEITNFILLEEENQKIFNQYLEEKSGISYIRWLEKKLTEKKA